MQSFAPRDEKDLKELVVAALANEKPLAIRGSGSRSGLGRPTGDVDQVDMSGLSGVIDYEPSELVIQARAGTPLNSITALLDQHNQELAFEPMNHGDLYGAEGNGTLGGMVAVNASGPRRYKSGACRDHLLGFRAVTGRGETIQSGGKVMKNVTGYDLSKLMAGSFGTMGILSEVTLKVLPKAETERTILIPALDDAAACTALTMASGLPVDISGLAHLAPGMNLGPDAQPWTSFRFEGAKTSMAPRERNLLQALDGNANAERLENADSTIFWSAIRDVRAFAGTQDQIWRISTAPSEAGKLGAAIRATGVAVTGHYFDWAGGLIWLAVKPSEDAYAKQIRAALAAFGGHATLIRASDEVRTRIPVFQPQPKAQADLSARVRKQFDPKLILNRGRMREDL